VLLCGCKSWESEVGSEHIIQLQLRSSELFVANNYTLQLNQLRRSKLFVGLCVTLCTLWFLESEPSQCLDNGTITARQSPTNISKLPVKKSFIIDLNIAYL
jgi:hypothetical protein